MTLQDFQQQATDLVNNLSPDTITYRLVEVTCSLSGIRGEASCRVYLTEGGYSPPVVNQTFKASSFERLLGKIERELVDVFSPQELESITL